MSTYLGGEANYYQPMEPNEHLVGCPYHNDAPLISQCCGGLLTDQMVCQDCSEYSDPVEDCLCDVVLESMELEAQETKAELRSEGW